MKSASFLSVVFQNIPQHKEDIIVGELFELGASGVSQVLDYETTRGAYEATVVQEMDQHINLEAFFENQNLDDLLKAFESEMGVFQPYFFQISEKVSEDWLSEWKKNFKPFTLDFGLSLCPSWDKKDFLKKAAPGVEVIFIEPGMAFGTGTHETTQLCLKAIESFSLKNPDLKNRALTALDMGAGSGILSVFLEKKGFSSVVACDVDEDSRENCQKNLELNDCRLVSVLSPDQLQSSLQTYDLVVANIIDGVLLNLCEDLCLRVKSQLILSGILKENKESLIDAFTKNSELKLSGELQRGEWVCLEFSKAAQ